MSLCIWSKWVIIIESRRKSMNSSDLRIDNRKDIILLLLFSPGKAQENNEPVSGRTRLMKLVFLFNKELKSKLSSLKDISADREHIFKAFHFGPFSKEVFDDIQFLENVGLIEEESGGELSMAELSESQLFYDDILLQYIGSQEESVDYSEPVFKLSDKGIDFVRQLYDQLKPKEQMKLKEFKGTYNSIPLSTLLRYVYKNYPESATESKIRNMM